MHQKFIFVEFRVNQAHFHMKAFTRRLVLKQVHKVNPVMALRGTGLSSLGAAFARDNVLCFAPRQISSVADPDLDLKGGGEGGFFACPAGFSSLLRFLFCFTQNKVGALPKIRH